MKPKQGAQQEKTLHALYLEGKHTHTTKNLFLEKDMREKLATG